MVSCCYCLIERQKLNNKIIINFYDYNLAYCNLIYDYNTSDLDLLYYDLNETSIFDCNTFNLDLLYYELKNIIQYDIIDEKRCYIENKNNFRLYDETKKSYYMIPFYKYPDIRYYENETMKTFINKFISFYDKHIIFNMIKHNLYKNYVHYNILNYDKLIESFTYMNSYKNLISIPETIINTPLIIPKEKINKKKQLKFRLKEQQKEQQKRFIKEYTLKKQKRKIYYK